MAVRETHLTSLLVRTKGAMKANRRLFVWPNKKWLSGMSDKRKGENLTDGTAWVLKIERRSVFSFFFLIKRLQGRE